MTCFQDLLFCTSDFNRITKGCCKSCGKHRKLNTSSSENLSCFVGVAFRCDQSILHFHARERDRVGALTLASKISSLMS